MANPDLRSLLAEIDRSKDASNVHLMVKRKLEKYIGPIGNFNKLSDEKKISAVKMVKTILDHLETRLKSRSRSRINLFKTHEVCRNYLKSLSQGFEYLRSRCGLMSCYEDWEKFSLALKEGTYILDEIQKLSAGKGGRVERFLPDRGTNNKNHDCSYLVLTVSQMILRSLWSSIRENGTNNEQDYHDILTLVNEMEPWFSYINQDEMDYYTTIREWIPMFLRNCTLSMVRQKCFWASEYCTKTLKQFKIASMIDQMHQFGKEILESSFANFGDKYFRELCMDIVKSVLNFMGRQCKKNPTSEETLKLFFKLVVYCTVTYGSATRDECIILASFLSSLTSEYFTEVTLTNVRLRMEHYAIALVINHFDSYTKWPIPKFSQALSIKHVLTQLEVHLKEFNDTYIQTEPNLHPFLCERISTLILSKYEECIAATEKYKFPIKLPVVGDLLGRFIEDSLSANCKSESIKHVEQIAKVAAAAFMLLVITKQDTKDFLKKLMKDGKFQTRVLTYFYRCLDDLFQPLYDSSRIAQAIETLQLCCDALWARVSLFCEMVKSSRYGVPSNCSLEDRIVDFVKEATEDSASLLRLHQRHAKDVNSTLRKCIERWVSAQKIFHILSPSALVHEWVTIQCQKVEGKDTETCELAPTILSMVPSLENLEQPSCIILEEELQGYIKVQDHYPDFCIRMQKHISATISSIKSREHVFERCKGLVTCGMRLGSCGYMGQLDCIEYMCEALTMLLKFNTDDPKLFNSIEYLNLVSDTCFSVALIRRLTSPEEKEEYIRAIKQGLKYFSKQDSKLTERECTLFFYVLDLLSLEGNMELESKVYRILIKRFKRKSEDLFNIAWQSGNLNHGLCSSPLDDYFIKIVPDPSSVSTSVPFWRTCVESESLATSFSILTTLSSINTDDDLRATKAQESTNDVIKSVSESENPFHAARLYFNLAEKMIAKGLIVEALTYAEKGYRLHEKLLSDCFIIEFGKQDGCEEETEKAKTYVCKRFGMRDPSRVSSLGSYCVETNVYVPTPWNLLKCYLESALQTGTLKYMIGSADEALCILQHGTRISIFQGLPSFLVGFSTALVKIWRQKRRWDLAQKELDFAQKSLKDCGLSLCKKCICVLGVKIDLEEGDLKLSRLKRMDKNAEKEALKAAIELFESAKSRLEESEWKNSLSLPKKKPPNIPVLCNSIAACESNEDCWHCLPSIVENSKSLENLSSLTWECIRRCHLLQVLTKLAKCSKLQGDIKEEHRFIMSSMEVVVARSTFHEQHLSTPYVESLLIKNVITDAFGVQYASILYHICCFSLKHKDTSGTDILSTEAVVTGLQMALILSREVPKLHEKVSRMLAVLFASFSKDEKYTTPKRVSFSQWAAYFHQLSIGSYFNSCLLSQDQNQKEVDGSHVLRPVLAPHSLQELEEAVLNFYKSLPSVTIVCISMLSDKLEDLLPKSPTSVWLMISRFSVKNGPIVVILPVCNILKDFSYKKGTSSEGDWNCPWADSVFDQVAPVLRLVLEEDSKTTNSELPDEDWMQMEENHNTTLHGFLRDLENLWLGPWKHLLLGEWDDIVCDVEEIENTLKSGCYIGTSGGGDGIYKPDLTKIFKNTEEANKKAKERCRNPVILVPQLNIQMIPWESLPILKKQQIYRMPSVGGVLRSISKCDNPSKDKTGTNPRDCYYFIPEEEDLEEIVESFKKWSKKFGFQGKAGCSVTVDELREALESHDLFVYAGHGSGRKYIPGSEIRKITNCCAAILMGCSSGYIYSDYHALESAPLDYLVAGSPAIVANIWPVCADTIIPFTRVLFKTWIKATLSKLVQCQEKGKKRKLKENTLCKHEINLGSSMSLARDACYRRYIHGAAPIVYGVPIQIMTSR